MAFKEKQKTYSVGIISDSHANLDSLPFRFGDKFGQDKLIQLTNCTKHRYGYDGCYQVDADFELPSGEITRGHFVFSTIPVFSRKLKTSTHLVVTLWRAGKEEKEEYGISKLIKGMRESNIITSDDLIEWHPEYLSGKLGTHKGVLELCMQKVGDSDSEKLEEIEKKAKEEKERLAKEKEELGKEIKVQNEKIAKLVKDKEELGEELKAKTEKIARLVKGKEDLKKEKVQAKKDEQSNVTLGEPALLVKVNRERKFNGSPCTQLVLEFADRTRDCFYMKTDQFDKKLEKTMKAENLVGKRVITSCWDPIAEPGKWSKRGYFNDVHESKNQ